MEGFGERDKCWEGRDNGEWISRGSWRRPGGLRGRVFKGHGEKQECLEERRGWAQVSEMCEENYSTYKGL